MNSHCSSDSRHLIRAFLGALATGLVLVAARAADGLLPQPSQAFTSKAALVIYVDSLAVDQSGIGKAIDERMKGLTSQFAAMPGMPTGLASEMEEFASLKDATLAELVVIVEGSKAFDRIGEKEIDPDANLLVAGRMTGTFDTEAFLAEAKAALDKEKAGLGDKVAATRSKVGAADVFRLPTDELGEPKIPFPMDLAIGPCKDGKVIAVGRSERLREYLEGKTEGRLPGALELLLPRRGQFWVYFPIPTALGKNLGDGNPMLSGLAKGLEKVRDLGLSMTFGPSAIDLELALGCTEAQAAEEMAKGFQQVAGMMQMMASQNPSQTPPMLGKLKGSAQGARFAITTALTMRDIEISLKNLEQLPGFEGTAPAAAVAEPAAEAKVVVDVGPQGPPLEVEFLGFLPDQTEKLRQGKLRLKSSSANPIREMRVRYTYLDAAGRPLGSTLRRQRDSVAEALIGANTERQIECPFFEVPLRTVGVRVALLDVIFMDGSRWTAPTD